MPKALPNMPILVYTMCRCELSEPASVQTHIFSQLQSGVLVKCLPLRTISWISQLRFCYPNLCLGIWYAFVSFGIHGNIILVSASTSASTSVDLCRDTSDITQKMSVYPWYNAKPSQKNSMNFDGIDEKWYQITALIAYPNASALWRLSQRQRLNNFRMEAWKKQPHQKMMRLRKFVL